MRLDQRPVLLPQKFTSATVAVYPSDTTRNSPSAPPKTKTPFTTLSTQEPKGTYDPPQKIGPPYKIAHTNTHASSQRTVLQLQP